MRGTLFCALAGLSFLPMHFRVWQNCVGADVPIGPLPFPPPASKSVGRGALALWGGAPSARHGPVHSQGFHG